MIFTFQRCRFDVPEGIEIVVKDFLHHGKFITDFDFVKDGEVIAMLGGIDENGNRYPTWNDVGIYVLPYVDELEEHFKLD